MRQQFVPHSPRMEKQVGMLMVRFNDIDSREAVEDTTHRRECVRMASTWVGPLF